jgi:hypothetical protein
MMEGDRAISSSRNGNKSLRAVDNAEYSASIVDVAMSPCSLGLRHQMTGQFATYIANPVRDFTQLGSCCPREATNPRNQRQLNNRCRNFL